MKGIAKTFLSGTFRASAALAAVAALSGCILPGGPRKTYLAEWRGDGAVSAAAEKAAEDGAETEAPALLPGVRVGPFTAVEPYSSTRMLVWEEETGRLHGTKGAQLAAPPSVTVQAAVIRALLESGAFESVSDSALASSGGAAVRGSVEAARLEKLSAGRFVYALRVSFAWREGAASAPRFAVCEAAVPAASAKTADPARAASAAAGQVAKRLLARMVE